jgi:hypothetical protein
MLIDDPTVVIYNRNRFIMQATDSIQWTPSFTNLDINAKFTDKLLVKLTLAALGGGGG